MDLSILHALPQTGDYPFAISLVAQNKIDLKPLVTHRSVYPFSTECILNLTTIK